MVGGAVDLHPVGESGAANNVAESALRPAVLRRKGSFRPDGDRGTRFVERKLTVVATCRQQAQRLLDFLIAAGDPALKGTVAPSLLSAEQGVRTDMTFFRTTQESCLQDAQEKRSSRVGI